MALGQSGEEVHEVGIGIDAIHLCSANERSHACPGASSVVMTGEERIAAVHGRATNGVFDEIGVDVELTVLKEQPEAGLALQYVGKRHAQLRLSRDARGVVREGGVQILSHIFSSDGGFGWVFVSLEQWPHVHVALR